jgi:hypothetical protein
MSIEGIIRDGVVILEKGVRLPEGTRVLVSASPAATSRGVIVKQPGQLPIVRGGTPGSIDLTNKYIHEILEEEDLEAIRRQQDASA